MSEGRDSLALLEEIDGILTLIEARGTDAELAGANHQMLQLRQRLCLVNDDVSRTAVEEALSSLFLENPRIYRAYQAWLSGKIIGQLELGISRLSDLSRCRALSPEEADRLRKAEIQLPLYRQAHAEDVASI